MRCRSPYLSFIPANSFAHEFACTCYSKFLFRSGNIHLHRFNRKIELLGDGRSCSFLVQAFGTPPARDHSSAQSVAASFLHDSAATRSAPLTARSGILHPEARCEWLRPRVANFRPSLSNRELQNVLLVRHKPARRALKEQQPEVRGTDL